MRRLDSRIDELILVAFLSPRLVGRPWDFSIGYERLKLLISEINRGNPCHSLPVPSPSTVRRRLKTEREKYLLKRKKLFVTKHTKQSVNALFEELDEWIKYRLPACKMTHRANPHVSYRKPGPKSV